MNMNMSLSELKAENERLRAENRELKIWKSSTIRVESQWDPQAVARALKIRWGESIREQILSKIELIKKENERLRADLAAAKADAERMQWLSERPGVLVITPKGCSLISYEPHNWVEGVGPRRVVDYAIDTARKGAQCSK